jgi:cell division protein YceG involved in septum cleavage
LLKKGKVTHVSFGKGLTTSEYSKMLYEAGLISNEGEFNDMVREHDAAKQLKPGVYTFEGGMEVEDIFNQIVEGPNTQLVIPEGASLQEVADLVEETYGGAVKSERMMEKFTNLDEYLKDYPFLEGKEDMDGYILPGTYNTQAFGLMEFDTARANLITRQLLDHYVEVNGEA